MKVLIGLALIGFIHGAEAQMVKVVTLSEKTAFLNVDISTTRLKLSQADYSSPVVKVLVPDLAIHTILDHRNNGEGAPCLATYDTLFPEDVIQNRPAIEFLAFKITLEKHLVPIPDQGMCDVSMVEKVEGDVRGFKFVHSKMTQIGNRNIEDCH